MDNLTNIQFNIMLIIKRWCKKHPDNPIPQSEIISQMKLLGVKSYSTLNAINSLIEKGYIRKSVNSYNHRTFYVMIRNVSFDV